MNVQLYKNRVAGAEIAPNRLLTMGAADGVVAQAAVSTALFGGVSGELGADAAGDRIDVALTGLAEVEYGGAVTRGKPLTSDDEGRAVQAASGDTVWGVAMSSGVEGDILDMLIAPSTAP